MLPTSLSFLALSSSSSCPVILPFDPLISSPSSRVPLFSFPAAHINLIRGPNTRASSLHSARKIKKRRYVAALKHRDEKTMISRGNRNRSSARDEDFKIDRDRFFTFRLMGEIWARMVGGSSSTSSIPCFFGEGYLSRRTSSKVQFYCIGIFS